MQYRTFFIPLESPREMEEEMNVFLRSRKIVSVTKEFIALPNRAGWSFAVEFWTGDQKNNGAKKGRIDYREVLSDEEFAVFCQLKEERKKIAEELGKPLYAIFTNEQLVALMKKRPKTRTAAASIPGIGKGKIEEFGDKFIDLIKEIYKEDSGEIKSQTDLPKEA